MDDIKNTPENQWQHAASRANCSPLYIVVPSGERTLLSGRAGARPSRHPATVRCMNHSVRGARGAPPTGGPPGGRPLPMTATTPHPRGHGGRGRSPSAPRSHPAARGRAANVSAAPRGGWGMAVGGVAVGGAPRAPRAHTLRREGAPQTFPPRLAADGAWR